MSKSHSDSMDSPSELSSSSRRGGSDSEARTSGERSQLATALFQVGAVMVGIFVILGIINSLPLALGQPDWIDRLSVNLQNLGITALMGAALIALSQGIERGDRRLRERVRLVRYLCIWATLGWVLLVPLQLSASFNVVRLNQDRQLAEIRFFRKVQKKLELARTETDLRAAMAMLPGVPTDFKITGSVPAAGADLSVKLLEKIREAEDMVKKANAAQAQDILKSQVRNVLYSLLMAIGFAAIAQPGPGQPTLLTSLLDLNWIQRFRRNFRL